MRIRSLGALTLLFLAVFAIVTTATGVALYSATGAMLVRMADNRITEVSDAVTTDPDLSAEALLHRIAIIAHRRETGGIGFVLTDNAGRRLGGNVAPNRQLPLGYSRLDEGDGIRGLSIGRAFVRQLPGGRRLATLIQTEPFKGYNAQRARLYVTGFGAIILVVLVGFGLFGLIIYRRIVDIRDTAEAIIDGDMARRVPIDGESGAFDRQAQTFNRMLDRIADLMAGISGISNDIAHDMRTPLARLRSRLARAEGKAGDQALREELGAAVVEADGLLAMFAAMLRIAEVEGGDRRAGFTSLDLAELAADVGATMEPVAAESGRTLKIDTSGPLPIEGDPQLISQLLMNLIENAIRHTPDGTSIVVLAQRRRGVPSVDVADDGPGIAAEQRQQALRRFGRLDQSRNRSGHGLGLALAQAIMRLHRGEIALEDAGPGLRVVLTWPVPGGAMPRRD